MNTNSLPPLQQHTNIQNVTLNKLFVRTCYTDTDNTIKYAIICVPRSLFIFFIFILNDIISALYTLYPFQCPYQLNAIVIL